MRYRRTKRSIPLPWEGKLGFVRDALGHRRWKALLAVLVAATLIWILSRVLDAQARTHKTYAAIQQVKQALYVYEIQHGRCPDSLVALFGSQENSEHEFSGIPTDGWGHELHVLCPSPLDAHGFEVFSAGPSGSFFDADNIY
ncbi:MAG: type II secretion system protein GspG [Myxococcales bacterium]|nr:type II secretion system protein GspG [Myxococcales bacterium]MCB9709271.1 type II secretion system protein GspG [Myxococcales bacterium]